MLFTYNTNKWGITQSVTNLPYRPATSRSGIRATYNLAHYLQTPAGPRSVEVSSTRSVFFNRKLLKGYTYTTSTGLVLGRAAARRPPQYGTPRVGNRTEVSTSYYRSEESWRSNRRSRQIDTGCKGSDIWGISTYSEVLEFSKGINPQGNIRAPYIAVLNAYTNLTQRKPKRIARRLGAHSSGRGWRSKTSKSVEHHTAGHVGIGECNLYKILRGDLCGESVVRARGATTLRLLIRGRVQCLLTANKRNTWPIPKDLEPVGGEVPVPQTTARGNEFNHRSSNNYVLNSKNFSVCNLMVGQWVSKKGPLFRNAVLDGRSGSWYHHDYYTLHTNRWAAKPHVDFWASRVRGARSKNRGIGSLIAGPWSKTVVRGGGPKHNDPECKEPRGRKLKGLGSRRGRPRLSKRKRSRRRVLPPAELAKRRYRKLTRNLLRFLKHTLGAINRLARQEDALALNRGGDRRGLEDAHLAIPEWPLGDDQAPLNQLRSQDVLGAWSGTTPPDTDIESVFMEQQRSVYCTTKRWTRTLFNVSGGAGTNATDLERIVSVLERLVSKDLVICSRKVRLRELIKARRQRGRRSKRAGRESYQNLTVEARWRKFLKYNAYATGFYVSRRKSFFKKRKVYLPKFSLKVLRPGREKVKTYLYLKLSYFRSKKRKNYKRLQEATYNLLTKEILKGSRSTFRKKKTKKYDKLTDANMKDCFIDFLKL